MKQKRLPGRGRWRGVVASLAGPLPGDWSVRGIQQLHHSSRAVTARSLTRATQKQHGLGRDGYVRVSQFDIC